MNRRTLAAALAALAWLAAPAPALAQSSPGWGYGKVPTPAEWNAAFASKQDLGGPCLLCAATNRANTFTAVQTITTPSQPGLILRSGASGSFVDFDFGRTAHEGAIGVAAANNQFLTGSVAGDVAIQALTNIIIGSTNSGTVKLTSPLSISPPTGTYSPGLSILQTGPSGAVATAGPISYNQITVTHTGGVSGSGFDQWGEYNNAARAFRVAMTIGGANISGQLVAAAEFNLAETIPNSGSSAAFDRVALLGYAYSTVSNTLGGGSMYGVVPVSILDGTGHSDGVIGMESDVGVASTASTNIRVGIRSNANILPSGASGGVGATFDAAYAVSNVGTDGGAFKKLIALQGSPFPSKPLSDDADFFYSQSAWTVANIFNLSNLTVTGKILNFPHATMDGPTGALALGTVASPTSEALLTLNGNAAALPANTDATERWLLRVAGVDAKATVAAVDSFGSFSAFVLERANGTGASKSAVLSGNLIGALSAHAYGTTAYGVPVQLRFYAGGDISDTSQPGRLSIYTTPTGSTGAGILEVARFDQDRVTTVFGGFRLNKTGGTLPLGTAMQIADAVNTPTTYLAETFTNSFIGSSLTLRMARGTPAAPTAVQSGDLLGIIGANGYGTTAYSPSNGQIRFVANQAFTDAAQGVRIDFLVTLNGATLPGTVGSIENDGGLTWPRAVTGGSKGAGTINATALYVGGTAVTGGGITALTGDVTASGPGSAAATLAAAQPAVHTWALAQTFTVAPVFTDQPGSRTALGLGTAATQSTGTSGANVPLLNGANTWAAAQTMSAALTYGGVTLSNAVSGTGNMALTAGTTFTGTTTVATLAATTVNAFALAGTISGGGNSVNNVVVGASTPLAGTFTVLIGTGGSHVGITSLGIRDTSAAFDVTIAAASSTALTAGRTLTVDVVNAARTVKLGASLTIATDPGGVTGALKSNGTGTFAQAACADLSNAGSYCSLSAGQLTNSLGANVALNNTSNYFDGPSVAQGTTGTWFASGTVNLTDIAGAATLDCKLWDGTTVIDSSQASIASASVAASMTLSGFIASPAGNIRISCKDRTSTSGFIAWNGSGNSKDATVTAYRIN